MSNTSASALDDAFRLTALDSLSVMDYPERFAEDCQLGVSLADGVDLSRFGQIDNVLLCGMGGSAVAGDYLKALFDLYGRCPFSVCRDYEVPNWVGKNTLVICSSFSGNTEETLAAYNAAKLWGAQFICITSGGKMAELAKSNGDLVVRISGGRPPRFAFPWMFLLPLQLLNKLGLLNACSQTDFTAFLKKLKNEWGLQNWSGANFAKQLALKLQGKTAVVYGLGGWQMAVAGRWKAQINENAKEPAFANAFPELNHNEILGWKGVKLEDWAIVTLEGGNESDKMKARRQFLFEQFPSISSSTVVAAGETLLEKMLALTLLGDYVSLYMSVLKGVDPGDIKLLDELKNRLA